MLLLLVGVVAALVVPLPYVALRPGSALAVEDLVDLGGGVRIDPVDGDLLLTTVASRRLTAAGLLWAWLDAEAEIEDRESVVPPGVDHDDHRRAQLQLFAESAEVAAAVGLQAAGMDTTIRGDGVLLVAVQPDAPAAAVLRPGDVIVGVDGSPVELASDLVQALAARAPGDDVRLTVRRDDRTRDETVRLTTLEDRRAGLGVSVATVGLDVDLPVDFRIDQRNIGGPSAGLMVALTVFDLADPVDLARGRVIAGTGTIGLDGRVGPIGGVRHKVLAARQAGADLFLVPEQDAAAARSAAGGDLQIVPVGSFDEAVAALRR